MKKNCEKNYAGFHDFHYVWEKKWYKKFNNKKNGGENDYDGLKTLEGTIILND